MSTPPKSILIGARHVGSEHPPFIVAELSANHGGDFDRAIAIIDSAAECGADAVKFQAYSANTLTLNVDRPDFVVDGKGPWSGRRLFDLYAEAATPYEWFPALFERCEGRGIIAFASAFDKAAVDMLEALKCPAYKVASFEAVDHDLIARCAATGKPLIISVGLCTPAEIREALSTAQQAGAQDIILLQCNSAYPSPAEEADLLTIPNLATEYGVIAGYSDHTTNSVSSVAACALGASVIEKHFIDASEPQTADSHFSITPNDLKDLVSQCRAAWQMRGKVRSGPQNSEQASLAFRRSLYVVEDVAEGEQFTARNVRSIRPAHGLAPKHLSEILGSYANKSIQKGEPMHWSLVSGKKMRSRQRPS